MVNFNDIGGSYSGIIYGISNTIGTIASVLVALLVGILTQNKTQAEWQFVYLIAAGVYTTGGLVFLLFAGGETLHWAIAKKSPNVDQEKELAPLKSPEFIE